METDPDAAFEAVSRWATEFYGSIFTLSIVVLSTMGAQ